MQVAMIGNMNNAPFLLAEGLRTLGVGVRLLVTRSDRLHHPVKAGLVETLPDWVHDASGIGLEAFERQDLSIGPALGAALHDTDLAILNDTGPSLHNLFAIPVVSFLTGSDLSYYANISSAAARRSTWSPGFISTTHGLMDVARWEEMVVRQRAGIRRSLLVVYPKRGLIPSSDALLDDIGVEDGRRIFLPGVDTTRIRPTPVPAGRPLKIFNGARLNWVEPLPPSFSDQDHKGSDKLLRGFARFLSEGGEGELTLVEKGLHIRETRNLAHDLGIERNIVWKAEMTMAEFQSEIEASHLICCNLGRSTVGQAGLAGLAAGRPVLADFSSFFGDAAERRPFCDARTPEDVARQLRTLYDDPDRRDGLGREARLFAEEELSMVGAARHLLNAISRSFRTAALENEVSHLRTELAVLREGTRDAGAG